MSIGDDSSAPRCAWATLLTSEHLLPGLMVFAHSLLVQHASAHPLVIMATAKLSPRARSILSSMLPSGRLIIRDIDPIYPTSIATGLAYTRFNEVWTKLRAFSLTEFSRVALVDSDMLVRHNMDDLFSDPFVFGTEGEWIGASWACTCNPNRIATYPEEWIPANCGFTPQCLPEAASSSTIVQPDESTPRPARLINSGLVLLTPSQATMDEMVEAINTDPRIPEYRFPDQDFLADFFSPQPSNPRQRNIRYLPYKYNALKKLRIVHPNIWDDEVATNVHYILDKPWTLGRPGGRVNTEGKDPDAVVHGWWWSAFDDVQKARVDGAKGCIKVAEEDWKDCVEKYMTLD
ncbi:Glycosyl transferase, family 8 [Kalmanozyma brasiliensis GHG001]|uniref:Galactinol synthase n=1 Tax=Kalmanozyma brasiliensis (strain GHG001) TaxID=1365824 RepID=V5EC44_KALBG|nr:Glycosyl transferase, family 8 [Kalmanozyma brasiliensis GHG001]EST08006.1 Glycosyl transferase, family 8 [Kalmanozyma brasiliensis GHG001]